MSKKSLPLLFLCFCLISLVGAQNVISGLVIDKETKEALPFVNISALPSNEGVSTDFEGKFTLKTTKTVNVLSFSYLGYESYTYKLTKSSEKNLLIELNPVGIQIEEAVVTAKKNKNKIPKDTLAISLQQLVVDHKDENRPKSFESYYYLEHNKIEFDYYKLSDKFTSRKIFKPFSVIFDYIDTTATGVKYLPLLLQEKLSEHYYRQDLNQEKNVVLGQYLTGVQNLSAMVILDDIFDAYDLYDNIIPAGGKAFTSPFSATGLVTYRYYLTDSVQEAGRTYYKLDFAPRSKESIAFTGTSLIDKESYAIKSIEFSIPKQANINYVGDFEVKQEFDLLEGGKWILKGESVQVALNPTGKKNAKSLMVRKNMQRDSIVVNEEIPAYVFVGEKLQLHDSLKFRSKLWWEENRIDSLSRTEEGILVMSDSIERTRAFKMYSWFGSAASTAFLKAGPVEFGRFYQFLSWNSIEGIRPKFGIRTNNTFNENFQLWSYLAYGTKDKDFKYFLNARMMLPRKNNNWHTLEFNYKRDFTFLGQDYEDQQFSHDNMFLAIMRTSPLRKIMLMESIKLTHERQWVNGYTTTISAGVNTFYAVQDVFQFDHENADGSITSYDKFNTTEIGIKQHIAFGQKFFENTFYRFEGFSRKPIIDLSYKLGIKNIAGSDFSYHKLELNYRHRLMSKIGYTYYYINAGKIFGDAPYPLMFIPIGNQNFYFNGKAFQMMNEFEFAADEYVSLGFEHHFDGLIFNKIPLINKLKLRSIVMSKALIGNASASNLDIIDLPVGMTVPENWYIEVGFGIENILQLMRVDFMWRLTQRDKADIQKFGVKFSIAPKL
ncbi:MAG: carboxypeptidase-like regulatory domain-containing protein [Chitinophagales bacterium]|nr:carboxypeptidase-like regulatory domain-containing protein [Chitinophagales bacterium]